MGTEGRSPCHSLRFASRAATFPRLDHRSLDNQHHHQYQGAHPLAAGGFFPPDVDGKYSVLLEESQAADPPFGRGGKYILCSSGQKSTEALDLLRFNSPLSHVAEGQEARIPSPHSLPGLIRSTSISDEEYSFLFPDRCPYTRSISPEDEEFRFSLPTGQMMRTSADLPHFCSSNEELQRPNIDMESLVGSFAALRTVPHPHHRQEVIVYAPVRLCYIDQDNFRTESDVPLAAPAYSHHNTGQSQFNMQFPEQEVVVVPNAIPRNRVPLSANLPTSSSVSSDEPEQPPVKTTLYKTELCRSWEETGHCRYSTKCQFAHGNEDLRPVPRHPKYKTEKSWTYRCAGHTRKQDSAATGSGAASSTNQIQCLPVLPKNRQCRPMVRRSKGQEDYRYSNSYASLVTFPKDRPDLVTCLEPLPFLLTEAVT